jgi:hypothetical protein
MILSLERRLALTPSVASLQALTSRSYVRFRGVAPHHRSPTSAMQPAGQDLGAPLRPKLTDSTAPMAPECQSFLDNVVAGDQRHLIAKLPRRITRERPVR